MDINKINKRISKLLSESYYDKEYMHEHITDEINKLVEASKDLTEIPETVKGIKDLIKVYSRIENLATNIMRYADEMQYELDEMLS